MGAGAAADDKMLVWWCRGRDRVDQELGVGEGGFEEVGEGGRVERGEVLGPGKGGEGFEGVVV